MLCQSLAEIGEGDCARTDTIMDTEPKEKQTKVHFEEIIVESVWMDKGIETAICRASTVEAWQ